MTLFAVALTAQSKLNRDRVAVSAWLTEAANGDEARGKAERIGRIIYPPSGWFPIGIAVSNHLLENSGEAEQV